MTLESLGQDLRYALRGLRLKPAFALAVISTIGLGIGANAAMFGIVDRLLFRPPNLLRDPATAHRPYAYRTTRGKEGLGYIGQYARYKDLERWTTSFSAVAGYTFRTIAVGIGEASREMNVGVVSANFFSFFDAPPALGRYFTAAEDSTPNGTPVVVVSDAMWQTQYGGRRDVLGTKVQIGPAAYTIIGVAPPGFVGLWSDRPPAFYIPITTYGAITTESGFRLKTSWWRTYSWGWMGIIVRRKRGVSIEKANADLTQAGVKSYLAQLEEQPNSQPLALTRPRIELGSIIAERGPSESPVAKVATWIGGVSLIVLLIACANVANLLLARAIRRRREIALRLAMGVGRARLVSQLLTETLLLALLGGVTGLLIAHWGGAVLRSVVLDQSEAPAGLRDPRTVLFAIAAAISVGLLTGLAPILQARRADLTSDLKSGSREGTFHRSRARVVLLVLQGALSVVLLVGAGLFVRSLRNVNGVRLGYDVDPVLLVDLNMRGENLDSVAAIGLRQRLLQTATTIPGVTHASAQVSVPFWSTWSIGLYVAGIDTVGRLGQFNLNAVSPDFFSTFGTRILRGRGIGPRDVENAPRAMVVSEGMGQTLWPGKDPIGQCIRVNADTMPCTYVVGVAENIKQQSLGVDSAVYNYYLPATQFNPNQGGLFIRVNGNAAKAADGIRRRLQREMPGASYVTTTPMERIIGGRTKSWHLGATLFVAFGVLALAIAAIGLYSVIAYNVAQRTHELGVRGALGAQASDLIKLVVTDGLRLALLGVVIGTAAALYAARWVKPLLFDVSATDPVVFASVVGVLVVVAFAASWLPALRASRVDPNVALRSE
jgi:putative ABC transport system permease protein